MPNSQYALFLILFTLLVGCSERSSKVLTDSNSSDSESTNIPAKQQIQLSFDSPESVFEACKAAANRGDFKSAAQCMTEKSQTMMAGSLIWSLLDIGRANQKAANIIEPIFLKHHIDPNAKPSEDLDLKNVEVLFAWACEPVTNKPQCIGDLYNVMVSLNRSAKKSPLAIGELKNVQVDGDQASGVLYVRGEEFPILFHMQEDGWRLQMPQPDLKSK